MKELLKSKTFWTGIASILGGIALILTGKEEVGMTLISTGLTGIFLRDGINKSASK